MKFIKSSNFGLIFSWGGFVFLSINFLVGASLGSVNFVDFLLANLFAFLLLAITMYAPVYLSVKNNITFPDAIKRYIPNKYISSLFILVVVFINVGWYSIQLEAVRHILEIENFLWIVLISYLFAFGAFLFGYVWLKNFSIFVLFSFLVYVFYSISNMDVLTYLYFGEEIKIDKIISMTFLLYGTWAFSSSSVIMDISKHATNFFRGYLSLLVGLLIGNFLLIFLGYIFAKSLGITSFEQFVALFDGRLGVVLLILNIWTTNDNNFYSSMLSLEKLGISHKISFFVLPCLSAFLVTTYKNDLFGIIGNWLVGMSYIGMFFTLFWWYIILKQRHSYGR